VIAVGSEFVGTRAAFLERFLAIALEHQIGGTPDIDLGYHAGKFQACGRETINTNNCMAWKPACQGGGYMAAILTAEDVVRRIAAECAYVNERGGVGIRLEPAAAIVRQYGEQFRGTAASAATAVGETVTAALSGFFLHLTFAARNPLNMFAQKNPSEVLICAELPMRPAAVTASMGRSAELKPQGGVDAGDDISTRIKMNPRDLRPYRQQARYCAWTNSAGDLRDARVK